MLWHTKGVLCALAYFDILRPKLILLFLMVINFLKVAFSQKVLEDFQIAPKKCRKLSWTIKILNIALKNCHLSFFCIWRLNLFTGSTNRFYGHYH